MRANGNERVGKKRHFLSRSHLRSLLETSAALKDAIEDLEADMNGIEHQNM